MDTVNVDDDTIYEEQKNTSAALIRGMSAGFKKNGHNAGGFKAYATSNVLKGSGLSSSAAYEVLIGTILNGLYNDGEVSAVEIAQFAENVYFGKPSGLMDQMASSVGGFITIDFADEKHPVIDSVKFDFTKSGHALCIVDTKGNHADLTPEYAAIPVEMKSVAAFFKSRTDYAQNPDKTEQGQLVSSYKCSPLTVDEEFMLSKRQYELVTGRRQKNDVIAYQIRQSFKPGEITAEEANKVGYELAMRFTKGKYAFLVATHTDREHIHNHIIYNSTALDCSRKFRDFLLSGLAVQRLSDLICLEHSLSVIEIKPYRERQKRVLYPPKESNRDQLCGVIDSILADKPEDYEAFLQKLEQQGFEVKRGKHTAVKGKGQKRFIRFRTLGTGYGEDEIKAVLEGKAKHQPHQKQPLKEQSFQLLVDIQGKMAEGKSVGYKKWATKFNLKEMSKTLLFLQEQKIGSAEELRERAAAATERYHAMGDSIKAAETRLAEIAVLKTHIINYAKTRPVYDAYRKVGYSKAFLEAHREEITLHKAAKAAFDEAGLQKLPKVKELDAEFAELLTKKKASYPDYRKARNEMQELVRAQKNVERFFAEEKDTTEKTQTR